nr:MAG TPA: hypothetical protein [Microviridae sp.]
MAFRNHKFSPVVPPPAPVVDEVCTSTFVGDVETPVVSLVPNSQLCASLPAPSSYCLSDLLAAGVPLTPVNSKVLTTPDSAAAAVVDSVLGDSDVSRGTKSSESLSVDTPIVPNE